MKFKYAFQKVLDVKTNEKKQTESELSQAIYHMTKAEQELSDLISEQQRLQQKLSEIATKGRPMADLMAAQSYIDHLEERIRQSRRRLAATETAVNELRNRLKDRSVDEKVWLNAKDRAYATYRSEADRRQQFEMDEMAAVRSRIAR